MYETCNTNICNMCYVISMGICSIWKERLIQMFPHTIGNTVVRFFTGAIPRAGNTRRSVHTAQHISSRDLSRSTLESRQRRRHAGPGSFDVGAGSSQCSTAVYESFGVHARTCQSQSSQSRRDNNVTRIFSVHTSHAVVYFIRDHDGMELSSILDR